MALSKVEKFGAVDKKAMMEEEKAEREKIKREEEEERNRQLQELKKGSGKKNAAKNVLYAQYQLDTRLNVYREVNPPPDSLFIGCGWDETPEMKRKHYRRYYNDELEYIKEVMPVESPFDSY